MIRAELFTELYKIFPEAFSITRTYTKHKYRPGPFEIEEEEAGTGTENLAECILYTANSISNAGIERGLKYLQVFKSKAVQRQEIKSFLK